MRHLCVSLVFVLTAAPTLHAWPIPSEVPDHAARRDVTVAPGDWPWWRGPHQDGIVRTDQAFPRTWDETRNVAWRVKVPGRGHGSPIVVADRVYLATAEKNPELQSLLCLDATTGKTIWRTVVHGGGQTTKGNKKSTQASSTPAWDGERLYVNFLNRDGVTTTALDPDGTILWQTRVTDYVVHQGYGSSPALYGPLVIVSADNKGGGAVAGLQRSTGELVWKRERPAKPNYASPMILRVAGRDQLVLTGCDLVTSLDPLTGDELWEIEGATTECVTSTVTDGRHIFTSGGYPDNHVSAVLADGTGTVTWRNNVRVYVPSMIASDGHLYAVTDSGVAMCWDAATGENLWKGRLGGTFTSSPVLVNDTIYAGNEDGEIFLFKASPDAFELIATNKLGDTIYATPTFSNGRIYLRVVEEEGDQVQEWLYCIGASAGP